MKLAYLTNSIVPSKRANVIHVLAMKKAFEANIEQPILVSMKTGSYEQLPNHLAIRYIPIPFFWWLYALWVNMKMRFSGYNIIYSRSYIGSYIATFFSPKSLTIELHTDSWNKTPMHKNISKRIFKKCNHIICITEALKDALVLHNKDLKNKINVIPDAAFENEQSGGYTLSGEKSALKLAYVGSLSHGKGAEILQPLSKQLPDGVELHVVTNLNNIDQDLYSPNKTFFYDFMPSKDVQTFLKSIDICLLPNQASVRTGINDYGKFTSPLKMFEYMAADKPIISSDIPVLREVLNPSNALLVSPTDINSWLDAIELLKSNKNLGLSLANQALLDFTANYTWDVRVKKIARIISK